MAPAEQTINLPQMVVLTLIGFLAIRWYFSSRTPSPSAPTASRINPTHVEQVLQMFPQLDRRTVMWELQKTGGSVAGVTEKVLSGSALERPPQSYQPPMPVPTTNTRPAPVQPKKPAHPDLITKYNLTSRVAAEAAGADASSESSRAGKKAAWSANKDERQTLLQKRREEMILAARRKMEERDATGAKS